MERRETSPHPAQFLAAAQAERAALEPDRIRPDLDEIAGKDLAPIGVVQASRPRPRAVRPHPDENRNANERPIAFGGVLVVLVGPWLAGRRVEPRLRGCDPRAQCRAAAIDADRS